MKKILYFYPRYSSFVASDHQLLSRHFQVIVFPFTPSHKVLTPFILIRQLLFLLRHLRPGVTMVSQFSGYHTFLPSICSKLFRGPHFIILHGTECNNFPEYGYGYKWRRLLFWFSKISLTNATRLLPVSEALAFQQYQYAPVKYPQQGFKAFYHGLKTPYTVIHNGVDPVRFPLDAAIHREPFSFATIATGLEDHNRSRLKGLDFICQVAERCPDLHFTFIGGQPNNVDNLPKNIKVLGNIENDQLFQLLNRHQFYVQWSVSEGFGISVVEAMMCGCVPIVSRVGILPEIAGPNGYVLDHKDVMAASDLLTTAVKEYSVNRAPAVRDWAVMHYSIDRREDALKSIIQSGR